jgi:hypothetical protein
VSTKKIFTGKDIWAGGLFELMISYPKESPSNLKKLLDCLWGLEPIEGPYNSKEKEPNKRSKNNVEYPNEYSGTIQYGVITLPSKKKAPFQTYSYTLGEGQYFISIGIPMGALAELKLYPVGSYPFGIEEGHKDWILELCNFYFSIAKKLFKVRKFDRGIVGFIVVEEEFLESKRYNIPKEKWVGYLINKDEKLEWHPPNVFKGSFT